ncbi:MAG: ABC transporter substrate-binding protein [Truepera sp.]|nr:ABC transporter substrate-binding protein [Truepera sp.]
MLRHTEFLTRRLMALLLGGLIALVGLVQAQPAVFSEAPMLAERVAAGALPPVAERLPIPEDVVVIEPVEEVGQYGGTIRTLHTGPGMGELKMIMYDPPVRWNRDYTAYIPGLFRGWEFNEDGTSVTFFMRRGLKWSDGYPFTTEDILFWWEDLALNPDFGAVMPPWWAFVAPTPGATPVLGTLEVVDRYTFRMNFAVPHWNVPYILASGFWNFEPMMAPKHFLSQFHPRYNPAVADYRELEIKRLWNQTPGHPTLFAWHTVEYVPGERVVFERNPFYWKVDTAGNQLPYVDRLVSTEVPEAETRLLKIIGGEVDLAFREVPSPRDLPVILDNQERGGYRWLEGWINGAGGWPMLVVNQDFVGDDYIRTLQRDKNFMRGLSLSIDREMINEAIWFGLGTVQQATITEQSWHFEPPEGRALFEEWAAWYADLDLDRANQYLDAAGLDQRDAAGWRLRADNGQPLELLLDIGEWGGAEVNAETAALLQAQWRAVGIRVVLNNAPTPEIDRRWNEGTYMVRFVHMAEMDLWTFPDWIFPIGNEVRAWPRQALWLRTGGAQGEEPGEIVRRLFELYMQGIAIPNIEDRHHLVWEAIRIHMAEGPFYIGITAGLPMPATANVNLRNIPDFGILGPWAPGGPGNTNPEQYFFRQ